jgi:hypothetical protein
MQNERFNELINGPLGHPLVTMRINRLVVALHYVVQECGPAGEKALEGICADYQRQDQQENGEGR